MKKLIVALFAILLAGYAAYYFLVDPFAPPSGSPPELIALVPSESEWVAYVDLAAWRSSPLLEHLKGAFPNPQEDPEYREFVRDTGFDYSRDLDRAVLALLPVSDPRLRRQSSFQVIVFADGRFDRDKISTHALKSGARESHRGTEMILTRGAPSGPAAKAPDEPILLAFLSDQRIAIADVPGGANAHLARSREALVAAARTPQASPHATAPHLERAARVAGAPFFAIGRAESLFQANGAFSRALTGLPPIVQQARDLLSDVRWLTITARAEPDHVRLSLYGECESVLKAGQLGLLLDGALLFTRNALKDPKTRAQLRPRQADELDTLLATARVERQSNVVEVRLEIPLALLSTVRAAQH